MIGLDEETEEDEEIILVEEEEEEEEADENDFDQRSPRALQPSSSQPVPLVRSSLANSSQNGRDT